MARASLSAPQSVKIRFAKRSLLLSLPAILGVAWLWRQTLSALGTREAFAAFVAARQESVRCRLCDLPYESALATTLLPLAVISVALGLVSILAVKRAFGPPVLEIDVSGQGIYRGPLRTVHFTVSPDVRIKVGPIFRFEPAVATSDGGRVAALNFRTLWADMSAREIRHRLSSLRADWRVD